MVSKDKKRTQLARFVKYLHKVKLDKTRLVTAIGLGVGSTIAALIVPLVAKKFIDGFSLSKSTPRELLLIGGVFLVQAAAGGMSVYLLNRVGQEVIAKLRDDFWKRLLSLPVAYFDENSTGETISRMTNDISILKDFIASNLCGFFSATISILGSIAVLFYLDWKMTLTSMIVLPVVVLIISPLGRAAQLISKRTQDETGYFTTVLEQVISEIRLVKMFNAERMEYDNGKLRINKLLALGIREGKIQAIISPLISLVMMIMLAGILGYGSVRVVAGSITAGQLVAFVLYLFQIIGPMNQLSGFFTHLQKSIGATERIISIMEMQGEDYSEKMAILDAGQSIHMENLCFSYRSGVPILKDLNFTILAGKVTAIVGPSGSGKTTFLSLLERFYMPTSGYIKLGGHSICNYTLQSWRSQISYVSQDSPMISGTIRHNICYGLDREVTELELRYFVKQAYAEEFIEALPEKFDTEVGERGVKLSGGQRQRLCIARAMLKNPKILMLDEATSNLDSYSESLVQNALKNLMRNRTTIIIAHRLATVVDADNIIFFENGKVTGSGNHKRLLQTHEMYREFARHQLQIS